MAHPEHHAPSLLIALCARHGAAAARRLLQLGWPPERRLPLLTWVALLPPGEAAEAVLAMEGARDLGRLLERAFGWSWAA